MKMLKLVKSWYSSRKLFVAGYVVLLLAALLHFGCVIYECFPENHSQPTNAKDHRLSSFSQVIVFAAGLHVLGYGLLVITEIYWKKERDDVMAEPQTGNPQPYDEYDKIEIAQMADDGCPNFLED